MNGLMDIYLNKRERQIETDRERNRKEESYTKGGRKRDREKQRNRDIKREKEIKRRERGGRVG